MSHQVWVRPYDKDKDVKLLAEWLYAGREQNRFDPELFLRGQAEIYTAFDETGVVGFIPVAKLYLVESLAFRPGLSPVTEAKALQAWQHATVMKAFEENVPDFYFVTFDETVLEFAQRYGWKKVIVPMLNLHVANLEGKSEVPDGRT